MNKLQQAIKNNAATAQRLWSLAEGKGLDMSNPEQLRKCDDLIEQMRKDLKRVRKQLDKEYLKHQNK